MLDKQDNAADHLSIVQTAPTVWTLSARQQVRQPRERLFPFFADAANLGHLTPPEMHFEIITTPPIVMQVGTLIDYSIKTWGIPLRWRTEITAWNPPIEFVDTQLRGPYAEWVHRHRFVALNDHTTLMEDVVRFQLPLGRLGAVAGPVVRRQLRRIFAYRKAAVRQLVESPERDAPSVVRDGRPGYIAESSPHPHQPR